MLDETAADPRRYAGVSRDRKTGFA